MLFRLVLNSWAQVAFLPEPPEWLGLQAYATTLSPFVYFTYFSHWILHTDTPMISHSDAHSIHLTITAILIWTHAHIVVHPQSYTHGDNPTCILCTVTHHDMHKNVTHVYTPRSTCIQNMQPTYHSSASTHTHRGRGTHLVSGACSQFQCNGTLPTWALAAFMSFM